MTRITIMIVDDHKLVREAWAMILNGDPRFEVIGDCSNAESAIMEVKELRPNVVIMDVNMTGMNGIEAVPHIRKFAPASKLLGVSWYTFPDITRKTIQAGASGPVTKNSSKAAMIHAIIEIMKGYRYTCKEIRSLLQERQDGAKDPKTLLSSLSVRQIQVISAVRGGHTSREMLRSFKCS